MDEDGQGMVEYVLILALVALVIVGALRLFATALNEKYETIGEAIPSP